MKPPRTILTLIVLLLLTLLADYYYLHIVFPLKKAAILAEINQQVNHSLKENPPQESENYRENAHKEFPSESIKDFSIKSEFEKCFLKSANQNSAQMFAQVSTANTLAEDLERAWGSGQHEIELENYHLKLPDNSEKRVQLLYALDEQGKKRIELRLFKVESDSIPERIPLKPDETFNPTPEFISSQLSDGVLKFHQAKIKYVFSNGFKLFIDLQNKTVFELQVIGPVKSLNCREGNCVCR